MAENGGGHALQCHLALSRNRPVYARSGRLGLILLGMGCGPVRRIITRVARSVR